MTDSKGVFWRPARDGNTEGRKQCALGPGWQAEDLHWKPGGALKERSEQARLLRESSDKSRMDRLEGEPVEGRGNR